ncbi:MFS transporter [Bradyrhizobium cenepequi]|uniref:MFS transporter n=1 Tax=Bradyrhizobium cenepequi TaxID=2821403 RepID=UPI001CE379E0|nr:MFS transporter [Bradyrhizobium cenepequi]MCA6106734.1 MFS transporter [Bradyrhizobium cenepequi]
MREVVIRSKDDVAEFVGDQPMTRSGLGVVLIALGGVFVDAYDFASLGIGVPGLRAEFDLAPSQLGTITAIMGVGAVIGGVAGGHLTDKIGRLRMFVVDLVCLVVATLGAALSPNIYALLFFRFLMGVGVGLDYPVAFSFLAEFVNRTRRAGSIALWVFLWQVAVAVSVFVALAIYWLGHVEHLWCFAVGFGALPALAILLLRGRYMSESPLWAANHVGLAEAARLLEKTYQVKVRVEGNLATATKVASASYATIFAKPYLARTILVSVVSITQSLEYFAVGFYLPSISTVIFGSDFVYAAIGTLLSTIAGAIGGLLAAAYVDRLGVRRLIITGYCIVTVSLLLFWWTADRVSPYFSIVLIYGFILGQTLGPGSVSASLATLSYPTLLRGTGAGWAQGMVRIGTIIGLFFFPLLLAKIGLSNLMLALALVPVAGLLSLWMVKWEPVRSRSEDDVIEGHMISPNEPAIESPR